MRLLVEGGGAAVAAACGLAIAGWFALPDYMAQAWNGPLWPEVAARADTAPETYGAPSWGTKPVLGLDLPAPVKLEDPMAQAEADFRRIEAETEREMARDRARFSADPPVLSAAAELPSDGVARVSVEPADAPAPSGLTQAAAPTS